MWLSGEEQFPQRKRVVFPEEARGSGSKNTRYPWFQVRCFGLQVINPNSKGNLLFTWLKKIDPSFRNILIRFKVLFSVISFCCLFPVVSVSCILRLASRTKNIHVTYWNPEIHSDWTGLGHHQSSPDSYHWWNTLWFFLGPWSISGAMLELSSLAGRSVDGRVAEQGTGAQFITKKSEDRLKKLPQITHLVNVSYKIWAEVHVIPWDRMCLIGIPLTGCCFCCLLPHYTLPQLVA